MTENEIINFLEDEINGLKEQKYVGSVCGKGIIQRNVGRARIMTTAFAIEPASW